MQNTIEKRKQEAFNYLLNATFFDFYFLNTKCYKYQIVIENDKYEVREGKENERDRERRGQIQREKSEIKNTLHSMILLADLTHLFLKTFGLRQLVQS